MPASRKTDLLPGGERNRTTRLGVITAKVVRFVLEGISARAKAMAGSPPRDGHAKQRSPS